MAKYEMVTYNYDMNWNILCFADERIFRKSTIHLRMFLLYFDFAVGSRKFLKMDET